MGNQEEEVKIIESTGLEVFTAQERASIDSQVSTAKAYPRNLRRVLDNSIVIATMSTETAITCRYSKPIGYGKTISGASVHLARIVCQQYGNIRVQQRIKMIDNKSVVAEAVAFDMETNYAVSVEARRSIIDKQGRRYSDSIVETNAMAIMAIAERNAILKVVPKSIIDNVYSEAFKFAHGDLSDRTKLVKERNRLFNVFKDTYAMLENDVIECIGIKTKEAVTAENIVDLTGYLQALKDKEITVEDLKQKSQSKKTIEEKKIDLKENKESQTKINMP